LLTPCSTLIFVHLLFPKCFLCLAYKRRAHQKLEKKKRKEKKRKEKKKKKKSKKLETLGSGYSLKNTFSLNDFLVK